MAKSDVTTDFAQVDVGNVSKYASPGLTPEGNYRSVAFMVRLLYVMSCMRHTVEDSLKVNSFWSAPNEKGCSARSA
eukprot:6475138-Amphidinium_carterae.3